MKLADPFNGTIFDQMFAEAVDTVTAELLQARPQTTAGGIADLQSAVHDVMLNTLNDVAFNGESAYVFQGDSSHLVNRVAAEAGQDPMLTETIISDAYTDSATGRIPNWFGNPVQAVNSVKQEKAAWKALQPSFLQRLVGTIVSPLGITGQTATRIFYVMVGLVVLVALAYVVNAFKRVPH